MRYSVTPEIVSSLKFNMIKDIDMAATDVTYLSVYQLSIYNRRSSRLIAINKLQQFICDKKQDSGIGISYNNECLIQNSDENNMSPSALC